MKTMVAVTTLLVLAWGIALGQQQNYFPLGVFTGRDSLNYPMMKDVLKATWVAGYGGDARGITEYERHNLLETSTGLIDSVISTRNQLIILGGTERMRYDAEFLNDLNGLRNFFGAHPTGLPSENAWRCMVNADPAGYMVRYPRPSSEFYNDTSRHYATFALKIEGTYNPTDTVVTLSVVTYLNGTAKDTSRTLLASSFPGSDNYYEFDLQFRMPGNSALAGQMNSSAHRTQVLYANCQAQLSSSGKPCDSIDIRVYWHGKVTTSLDYAIVQDSPAHSLFAGYEDARIDSEATTLTYTHVQRLFFKDEPLLPHFLPYNYIDNRLVQHSPPGRGITIVAYKFQRFTIDAQPHELLIDSYPIFSSIPSPRLSNNEADDLGIERYQGSVDYNARLQLRIEDVMLRDGLRPADSATYLQFGNTRSLWFVPQMHGEYIVSNGKFQWPPGSGHEYIYTRRPPTGDEIKMMINLALTYGAKGILAYPFTTDSTDNFGGERAFFAGLVTRSKVDSMYQDHSKDSALFPYGDGGSVKQVRMGYREKWDTLQSVYTQLKQLAPTLLPLQWQAAKSFNNGVTTGPWSSSPVTSVTVKTPQGYADNSSYVDIGYFSSGATPYLFVTNRRCGVADSNARNITVTLNQGKVVTNVTTGNMWLVPASATFTERFAPAEGKLYRLDPITAGIQVPAGKELTVEPGANVALPATGIILVYGKMTALGTSSSGIMFTTNAGTDTAFGVELHNAHNSSFQYCTFRRCTSPIAAFSTNNLQISNCTFDTSSFRSGGALRFYGGSVSADYITVNGTQGSCTGVVFAQGATGTLSNSTIQQCGYGQGVYVSGGSSPTISDCIIRQNHFDGILVSVNGSAQPILERNAIDSNGVNTYFGVFFYNSNGLLEGNTARGSLYGIVASDVSVVNSGSTPDGGCNVSTGNTYGLLSYNYSQMWLGSYQLRRGSRNHFMNNVNYEAVAGNNSSITGYYDYWGLSAPPFRIYTYGGSSINTPYYLPSPNPCGDRILAKDGVTSEIDTGALNVIEGAYLALTMHEYETAASMFKGILQDTASAGLWGRALVGLYAVFTETKDKALIDYIARVSKTISSLSALGSEMLMSMNTIVGEYGQVFNLATDLRSAYAGTDVEIWALIHLASLAGYSETQNSVSAAAYAELVSKFGDKVNLSLLAALTPHVSPVLAKKVATPQSNGASLTVSSYPNPFNPTTTIKYYVPVRTRLSLCIYDILGRRVSLLADGYHEPGEYSATWNGMNDGGQQVASGVYFARLVTRDELGGVTFSKVNKLLLMK